MIKFILAKTLEIARRKFRLQKGNTHVIKKIEKAGRKMNGLSKYRIYYTIRKNKIK